MSCNDRLENAEEMTADERSREEARRRVESILSVLRDRLPGWRALQDADAVEFVSGEIANEILSGGGEDLGLEELRSRIVEELTLQDGQEGLDAG